MANKYQLINEMASETLKEITQNGESWIKFLNTASNNYKYSFVLQINCYFCSTKDISKYKIDNKTTT